MTSEEQPSPAVQDPAGQQLRRAREALGLSLEQVAEAQHLRPSVIQDIEQGRGNPTLGTVAKLLAPFGLKLAVVSSRAPRLIQGRE